MTTSITPFNDDPLGCYNHIDQKKCYTSITINNTTNTVDLINFSNTGDALICATLSINCTSIGASPNIVGYYNGHIIISITNGIASIVCSQINEICSESEDIDVLVDIDTSTNPPKITCELQGANGYTIYWAIVCDFKITDGLMDPYCPQPNPYVEGTPTEDEINDPKPSEGPPITPPQSPPEPESPIIINPPLEEIQDEEESNEG